ncbi:MAG: hypothetical protein O7F73_06760 [Gammaproteobacteria bacterium]|nr:hypothetical protein [Gammaproteobacteria bacterium]
MNRLCISALALLTVLVVSAGERDKPRWMLPEQGFLVEESDAKVESVTEEKEKGVYRIEISLPKLETPIEEVLVIGQTEDKPEFVLPKIPYEIINDLDGQRSGIVIYLGEKRNFALRINYEDGTQAALPPKVGVLKP